MIKELGSLTIFDIDDTLFHTTAKVSIIKNGIEIHQLSNQEFNTYKLKDGESFNFTEFTNAYKFYHESKPIGKMLATAKIILEDSIRNKSSNVIIVTARGNFDNKDMFLDTFRKHNFDIDKVRVERAGNITDIENNAVKKFIIIRNYLRTNQYNKVQLFDDNMDNLWEFLKLKHEFPDIKLDAYFAKLDGTVLSV
jgi:hypothetical protein